ncbi:hypothetical protein FAZ69_07400 [Trinickia terrae]|uniref:Uncharacterized protein n=1 Tax=Trinickia terrae TaxID=2571161 RepID=A0A4U1ICD0_9BURK|nr:hypothetical protein [Trinickia terrae]TKC91177.1 hypothetical protein FAZ69_07400 [Trinickia terrae]
MSGGVLGRVAPQKRRIGFNPTTPGRHGTANFAVFLAKKDSVDVNANADIAYEMALKSTMERLILQSLPGAGRYGRLWRARMRGASARPVFSCV